MTTMLQADVPSPINFLQLSDAQEWERTAMDRPFRLDMFQSISDALATHDSQKVLELGSGPGFLAKYLLTSMPQASMTLLDFSSAMHSLAKKRLGKLIKKVSFLTKNFKTSGWNQGIGEFDAVISNQSVHELRHKRHAEILHNQVKHVLSRDGIYLVCDHFFGKGGLENDQLFMTVEEQTRSLVGAGFKTKVLLQLGSLVLIQAT